MNPTVLAPIIPATLADIQHATSEWADATFPGQTTEAKVSHLKKEVEELALKPGDPMELADCQLLLCHIAERAGVDLIAAAALKLSINKRRKWGKPDADGVYHHVEEPDNINRLDAALEQESPLSAGRRYCNERLQALGNPYPRTCMECGLGPCKHPNTAKGAVHIRGTTEKTFCNQETLADFLKDPAGTEPPPAFRLHSFTEKAFFNQGALDGMAGRIMAPKEFVEMSEATEGGSRMYKAWDWGRQYTASMNIEAAEIAVAAGLQKIVGYDTQEMDEWRRGFIHKAGPKEGRFHDNPHDELTLPRLHAAWKAGFLRGQPEGDTVGTEPTPPQKDTCPDCGPNPCHCDFP